MRRLHGRRTLRPPDSGGSTGPDRGQQRAPDGGGIVFSNAGFASLGLTSLLSLSSWLVPGFALGLPGLLIVLVILAQLFGAGVFLPITRRVLGDFGIGRRSDPRGAR